jgi:hypothetical protein
MPVTTHNPEDDGAQSTGFGELFAGVGYDLSDEEMAEGRFDGWIDENCHEIELGCRISSGTV